MLTKNPQILRVQDEEPHCVEALLNKLSLSLLSLLLLLLLLLLLQKLSQETDAVLAGQVSTELAFILGRSVSLSLIKRRGLKKWSCNCTRINQKSLFQQVKKKLYK